MKKDTAKKTKVAEGGQGDSDLRERLVRALADYDNLKKRTEKEKDEFTKMANTALLVRLLPVIDIMESAQSHLSDQGLEVAIKDFKVTLSEFGFEEILPKKGEQFNENTMEAVEAGGESDRIEKVVLPGWRVRAGRVIRPAKVICQK